MAAAVQYPSDIAQLPPAGSAEASVDVVVSGAGPVGLFMGCLLKQAGVDVVVVDPHVLPNQGSKAAVTMPRSFEQLELAGVGEDLLKLGRPVTAARMSLGANTWTAVATGFEHGVTVQTRHKARTVGQNYVEASLAKRFQELGGRLYRAARFTGYCDSDGGVAVDVERSAYVRPPAQLGELPAALRAVPKTTFQAKFLVGCDGKQSAVRSAMGVAYEGKDYSDKFLLADITVPEEQVKRLGFQDQNFHIVIDAASGSLCVWFHLQDQLWRTYFCKQGLTRDNLSAEFLQERWREVMPPPGVFEPTAFHDLAFFEVSCRLAREYRRGRTFIAGDAAHCHSPVGGQGMNTGLQDAANLAWKLAAVLKGEAPEALLESYERERRPIAEWVLSTSDSGFSAMTQQRSAVFCAVRRAVVNTVLSCVDPSKIPPAFILGKMQGLTHSYSSVGTCKDTGKAPRGGVLRAGDRFPDLHCRQGGKEGPALMCTQQLLQLKPNSLLLLMVDERGCSLPAAEEVEQCLSACRPLLGGTSDSHPGAGFSVCPVLFNGSGGSSGWLCSAPQSPREPQLPTLSDAALAGYEPLRSLVPEGAKDNFGFGDRALLLVRPDGYIAASHVGSWDATSLLQSAVQCHVLTH